MKLIFPCILHIPSLNSVRYLVSWLMERAVTNSQHGHQSLPFGWGHYAKFQPVFFLFSNFWCSQDGAHPWPVLAKHEFIFFKIESLKNPYIFLATYLNNVYQFGNFLKMLFQTLAFFFQKNHWICNIFFKQTQNIEKFLTQKKRPIQSSNQQQLK